MLTKLLKFFIFIFLFSFYIGFLLITPKITYAVCAIKNIGDIAQDFNGTVTLIPTQEDCFPNTQQFIVAFSPVNYTKPVYDDSNASAGIIISAPFFSTQAGTGQGINCTEGGGKFCGGLSGQLNLAIPNSVPFGGTARLTYLQGQKYNGPWKITVCQDVNNNGSITNCLKQANVIANGNFTVTSQTTKPTTAPSSDLPEIDVSAQDRCVFRAGVDDVIIKKITKIYPEIGTQYQWWWSDEGFFAKKNIFARVTTGTETEFSLTIPANQTANFNGFKNLCVDNTSPLVARSQIQNCLTLTFQNQPADPENSSCSTTTRAAKNVCTPDKIKECKGKNQVCALGKCVPSSNSLGKQCGDQKNDPNNPAIATAIGCIHTNPINFIEDLLKFLTAIGGGFAFLLMLLGAFQMVSSAGNPETLQAGRDRFQSALIGLLFVIFAVLLLKIIGVDILALPGFENR